MMLIFVKKIRNYTGYVPFYLRIDPWNILSTFNINTTCINLILQKCRNIQLEIHCDHIYEYFVVMNRRILLFSLCLFLQAGRA